MQEILLSSSANQRCRFLIGDQIGTIRFRFLPTQPSWYMDLEYGEFSLMGQRLVLSPNMLSQWRRVLGFGLACASPSLLEPRSIDSFSSGANEIFLLDSLEVAQLISAYGF